MADQENVAPLEEVAQAMHSSRPKRPPPITPKRFTRFFTPRTLSGRVNKPLTTRASRSLRDITTNGSNRRKQSISSQRSSARKTVLFADVTKHDSLSNTPAVVVAKKRKAFPTPISSPPQSSPCKRTCLRSVEEPPSSPPALETEDEGQLNGVLTSPEPSPEPIICLPLRRARASGLTTRVLERSFGAEIGGFEQQPNANRVHWEAQTANFYSTADDLRDCRHPALPFCTASCNTNSLVAVGDEDGGVTLIESDTLSNQSFSTPHIRLHPHRNAILDLAFSSDDLTLGTASGDQSVRIIDMRTQLTKFVLTGHDTSVKQVRFQPGNDNIIATSSRDGNILIWDTRCHGEQSMIAEYKPTIGLDRPSDEVVNHKVTEPCIYATMASAHQDQKSIRSTVDTDSKEPGRDVRRGDVSVTSLAFLGQGREHLLLSASDASTSVKLWDIRARYSRRGAAVPVSTAQQPDSHKKHRHFGVSSIVLSGDSSKLYALSRDNTIYAYSTSHLVLGASPTLSPHNAVKSKHANGGKSGLGPMYGFRHPQFHVASFYVKMALRPAMQDRPEMLAVGSSDRCAIVYPTDERFFGDAEYARSDTVGDFENDGNITPRSAGRSSPLLTSSMPRPKLARTASVLNSRLTDTVPIHAIGTPLVGGHTKEVTGVTWTTDGRLITIGDDYVVRRWNEDAAKARALRSASEGQGERWRSGWADVGEQFDADEW